MRHQNKRAGLLLAFLALLLVLGGGGGVWAQSAADDWTVLYRPALLPDFWDDMAALAEAPRYVLDVTLAVDGTEAIIGGQETVRYTTRLPGVTLETLVFRLYPNLESFGGEMTVSRVLVDGKPATPQLDATQTVLTVPLPAPLRYGESVEATLAFQVRVVAGRERFYNQFAYLDGMLAVPNAYPLLSVYQTGAGWWQDVGHPQGDVVFSETSFYDVHLTAPANWSIAASGTEVGTQQEHDGTLTHHIVAPLMREFAWFASSRYDTSQDMLSGTAITCYYDPTSIAQASAAASVALQRTMDAVSAYNRAFGRYPFTELDVVQTPTTAGGIEYPGMFVVSTPIWGPDNEFFSFVLAHEAAHQWWYSLVGDDPVNNPWMDEALAQFSVALYIRDQEGEAAYRSALESFRRQYREYVHDYPDQVIGLPVRAYPDGAYFFIVYQKGPLFFATLADEYGWEPLLGALQDYFAAYRYHIATPEDMLAQFQRALGYDVGVFFSEWVGVVPVG